MMLQMAIFHSFLWLSNIPFVCVCVYTHTPHLLKPVVYQWALGLFLCLGYRKRCCYEHWDMCIFSNQSFRLFWIYAQEWDCWVIWQFYFQVFKEPPYFSPQWLYQFTFPPTVYQASLFSTSLPAFISCLFGNRCPNKCEVISHCGSDLHFPDGQ